MRKIFDNFRILRQDQETGSSDFSFSAPPLPSPQKQYKQHSRQDLLVLEALSMNFSSLKTTISRNQYQILKEPLSGRSADERQLNLTGDVKSHYSVT
jgi:hypothetical protein